MTGRLSGSFGPFWEDIPAKKVKEQFAKLQKEAMKRTMEARKKLI